MQLLFCIPNRIQAPGGEYQSRIRDLYDNSIVTYKTAASQTVYIVLDG